MLTSLDINAYLGPARITQVADRQVADRRVRLQLHDQQMWAELALALPYRPAVGDRVLAIGQDGAWYVIGVLEGSGTTTLTVPGDFEVQAPRGAIRLVAGTEVAVQGPVMRLKAHRLEVIAGVLKERFQQAARWVQQTFRVHADRMVTRVKSDYRLNAERIKEKAKGTVDIDGERINLG
jgi:hypothetical protein